MKKQSEAQVLLQVHLRELWPDTPIKAEHAFAPDRKWRFDVAVIWSDEDCEGYGFEIDGGAWSQGRHTRGAGFIKDMEKLNVAAALNWKVFRFTPKQILDGTAKDFIEKYL